MLVIKGPHDHLKGSPGLRFRFCFVRGKLFWSSFLTFFCNFFAPSWGQLGLNLESGYTNTLRLPKVNTFYVLVPKGPRFWKGVGKIWDDQLGYLARTWLKLAQTWPQKFEKKVRSDVQKSQESQFFKNTNSWLFWSSFLTFFSIFLSQVGANLASTYEAAA